MILVGMSFRRNQLQGKFFLQVTVAPHDTHNYWDLGMGFPLSISLA